MLSCSNWTVRPETFSGSTFSFFLPTKPTLDCACRWLTSGSAASGTLYVAEPFITLLALKVYQFGTNESDVLTSVAFAQHGASATMDVSPPSTPGGGGVATGHGARSDWYRHP